MKKTFIVCVILLALFGGSVKADTLYKTSDKNGEIKFSLTTSQGYVGALDLTLSLSGNVKATKVSWDNSLEESYVKKSTIDGSKIRIYLATGNAKKNLVTSDGKINIGTITVTSKGNSDETFNIDASKLTVTDIEYNSVTKTDLKASGKDLFTYTITPTGNTTEEKTNSNTSKSQTSKSDAKTSAESENIDKEDNQKDDSKETTKSKDKSEEAKDKEEKQAQSNLFSIIAGATVVIIVVGGIVFYIRKNRFKL